METLAQRSSILSGGAPIGDPIVDFTLEHAVEVCEAIGYSLVVSAPGPRYGWFTEPKPGTKPVVLYNDRAIFGDKIVYFGKWHYLKPPPARSIPNVPTTKTTLSAPALASAHAPTPAPAPQQQSPPTARGSSNEARDDAQAPLLGLQHSSPPVPPPTSSALPTYQGFDRTAYGAPRPVPASKMSATLGRWSSLPKSTQTALTERSKPTRSKLPPRVVVLEVDKSQHPQQVDIMRIPDVMGRRGNNAFVRSSDLAPVTPAWNDDVASLIGNLCPMNLMSRNCPNQEGCVHKHICPAWKKGEKKDGSHHELCKFKGIEHDGLVHIVPTCRNSFRRGGCDRPRTQCGYGHDHMEVRMARKDMLRLSNEEVTATNVYPQQVIHEIKYV
jgi:hypothetical protein